MSSGAGSAAAPSPRSAGAEAPVDAEADAESGLSDRDRRILAFENERWAHSGAKDDAIRTQFGFSSGRYYQLLNALIDSSAAYVYDPQLVGRLQRVREARMGERTLARPGGRPQHTTHRTN